MTRTRIKICGVTTAEAARVACAAGADAIGVVLVESSPRFVDDATARQVIDATPPPVSIVGVVMAADLDRLRRDRGPLLARLDCIQVHGAADEAALDDLPCRLVRALAFDPDEIPRWDRHRATAALLIEGAKSGTGCGFDHARLAALMPRIRKPVFLAGGLTPENVGGAIHAVQPFAVDVSSGVESFPGIKDGELIVAFCRAVQRAGKKGRRD